MQIERRLLTQIWAHALEYPGQSVFGSIHLPDQISRLGTQALSSAWVSPLPAGIEGLYQSFESLPPPPLPGAYPEGFLFLGAYMGERGVLEAIGYRVISGKIQGLNFSL